MIRRAPPPREAPLPPPPPYKEPPHIILERRAEMAEVTTGSLAQGEQLDIVIIYWGHTGLLLMCANVFAKLKLNVDIMDKIFSL